MRPVNLNNNRIMLIIPLQLKRRLYEEAKKEGFSLSSYIIQILWRWERGQNLKTGE